MNGTPFSHATPEIGGWVAPGFESVRRAFAENLNHRNERGAACAAYHEGDCVVDLWGGFREAEGAAPWKKDTLVLVFSATKGVAAAALVVLHAREGYSHETPAWEEHKPAVVLHSDDTETLIDTLREQGVPITMEPTDSPWGTFAHIEDPDGNRLSVRTPAE